MDERLHARPRLPNPRMQSLYAAVVVGLAVFLLLALLFPAPIQSYRARGVVEQAAVSAGDASSAQLLTQEEVNRIAEGAFAALHDAQVEPPEAALAETVDCRLEPSPQMVRVTIEIRHRHADWAQVLCDRIAGEILALRQASFVPGLDKLKSQRADVQQRLMLVRDSLQSLDGELRTLEREQILESSAALQRIIAAQAGAITDATAIPREYVELEAKMRELVALRRELTRTRTANHPEVQDVDARISALKAQLDELTPAVQASVGRTSTAALPQPALQQLDEIQAGYRRRSRELNGEIARSREREVALVQESARLSRDPAAIEITTRLIERPRLVDRVGGRPSLLRIGGYLALATAAALMVYSWACRRTKGNLLKSAEDVHRHFGLPVLAVTIPGVSSVRSPSRWLAEGQLVLAAEGTLAALVLIIILLGLLQGGSTASIASDPFGGIAEICDRTLAPPVRR